MDDIDRIMNLAEPHGDVRGSSVEAEVREMAAEHRRYATARPPRRARNGILIGAALIVAGLTGAAVGSATAAAPPKSASHFPPLPPERHVVMQKAFDDGTCELSWTITIRKHVGDFNQQLDDAAAYLSSLDASAIEPDAEWLTVVDDADASFPGGTRSALDKKGDAFMMAVAKSAWYIGGVSDEVIGMETMTHCTDDVAG